MPTPGWVVGIALTKYLIPTGNFQLVGTVFSLMGCLYFIKQITRNGSESSIGIGIRYPAIHIRTLAEYPTHP